MLWVNWTVIFQWYIKIDSNQFFDITMTYNNLRREISVFPSATCISGCRNMSCKFNVGKVRVFKKFSDPSSLFLIKMLGLNITVARVGFYENF